MGRMGINQSVTSISKVHGEPAEVSWAGAEGCVRGMSTGPNGVQSAHVSQNFLASSQPCFCATAHPGLPRGGGVACCAALRRAAADSRGPGAPRSRRQRRRRPQAGPACCGDVACCAALRCADEPRAWVQPKAAGRRSTCVSTALERAPRQPVATIHASCHAPAPGRSWQRFLSQHTEVGVPQPDVAFISIDFQKLARDPLLHSPSDSLVGTHVETAMHALP